MDVAGFSIELLLFLFLVAAVAGFVDTLAGGGGLLSIPALILSGVPPLAALGTNKLQGSVGTATATFMMLKKKRVDWASVKYLMLSAFIGSALGTVAVQFIDTSILSFMIPLVLVFIAVYFLISPKPANTAGEGLISAVKYRYFVVPGIGCYDGMFGPGTGSFFALSGVSCRGFDLISATAVAKPLNFSTNIASLMVFLMAGQVVWVIGLLMMLGQVVGAYLGSHCLLAIKPVYLRRLIVLMCTGMLLKYSHSMGWLTFA
ncbi:MAG: TSUP family transporter [Gammaproteobacteria bacterium]|nr:TSUP family transporter [Gammaproteobacteria bacterium]